MSTHKIITIILIILALFLGISIYMQNKAGELIIPNIEESIPTTTTPVPTSTTSPQTTPTKPAEVFSKEVTLSSINYYEFPDGASLSLKQVNDSRCASNVNCIWAGNIIALFNLKKENYNETFELKFGAGVDVSEFSYGEYKIKITAVQPDRGPQNQILTQKDYKITITISK